VCSSWYRFVTRWRVEGTPEEVFTIIEDTPDFVRWWPAVWLLPDQPPPFLSAARRRRLGLPEAPRPALGSS
jgi:hypothetical protein